MDQGGSSVTAHLSVPFGPASRASFEAALERWRTNERLD